MKKLSKVFKSVPSIFVTVIIAIVISYMMKNHIELAAYVFLVLFLISILLLRKLWEEYQNEEPLDDDEYAFRAEEVYILFDSDDYDKFLEKCIAPLWGKDFIVIDKDGYQLSTDYCDDSLYPITVYRLLSRRTDDSKDILNTIKQQI